MELKHHLVLSWVLHIVLVTYGEVHDAYMNLPYTDIDYHVFSDAAWYISCGKSPYMRFTYRYPPILAVLLLPNIWIHKSFGKILFSTFNVLAGGLGVLLSGSASRSKVTLFLCLYNPLTAIISSRGNADSLSSALVLLSIIAIRWNRAVTAGITLAAAAHLRVYPVLFTLPMWLSLGKHELNGHPLGTLPRSLRPGEWFNFIYSLIFEKSRCRFFVAFVLTFVSLTAGSYALYGYEFLQESYLYHLTRVDTRHNLSVHFYALYLGGNSLLSILAFVPQFLVLILFGLKYSSPKDVPFACFCQAFVFVAFNKVITAQYFLWPLSILPAVLPMISASASTANYPSRPDNSCHKSEMDTKMKRKEIGNSIISAEPVVNLKKLIALVVGWLASLGSWLLSAYLLEFLGFNTFLAIWVFGLFFFGSNVCILRELVKTYECNRMQANAISKKSL